MSNMQRLTPEDIADIRRAYRDAKYPDHQIDILCQLYLLSRSEVMEVCGLKQEKLRRPGFGHNDYRCGDVRRDAILQAVLKDGVSVDAAAARYCVNLCLAREWVRKEREKRGDIPKAKRLPLLHAVLIEGLTTKEAARRCDIKYETALRWVREEKEKVKGGDDRDKRRAAALPGHQPGAQTT